MNEILENQKKILENQQMILANQQMVLANQQSILDPNQFLKLVSSVIHIGANSGQERDIYERYGLKVLWIEPIPNVFQELKSNIANYKSQQAVQALVTDVDNKTYEFHLASNGGQSSSILELNEHKDIWPNVKMVDSISIRSKRLGSVLEEQNVDFSSFEALIMDTQGSELLVLKGAESILKHFRFIKTEVADFDSYSDCCTLEEIDDFLKSHNFRRFSCHRFARRDEGGAYYDVTYENIG